jgi:hypothetical protein
MNLNPLRLSEAAPHFSLGAALSLTIAAVLTSALAVPAFGNGGNDGRFRRIATFPVYLNTCNGQPDSCIDEETLAEIVAASKDGKTLIYTDAATDNIGFVDITDPSNPQPAGLLAVGGQPTSVAVAGHYALAAVDTSPDFVNPSGHLHIVHIATRTIVRTIDVGGQPDSVAISPDGKYAVIVIENQRNEEFCVGGVFDGQEADEDDCIDGGGVLGGLPQLPAGFLVVVTLKGQPAQWQTANVDLTGLAAKFPEDPEPEYVDINKDNVAVVTLQENNSIVLVHLPSGKKKGYTAGTVDLKKIDIEENDLIEPDGQISGILREPDGVNWISEWEFATADEGDFAGGSRGFTIFEKGGKVTFKSGNDLEHLVMRIGHYPESRSENKGNEPESAVYAQFGGNRFLFIGSERSSIIAVYKLDRHGKPEFVQALPAGVGPEGLLPIPHRNLFVASSETDAREDGVRGALTIYKLQRSGETYPTILSVDRPNGTPIPWGALSALAADPTNSRKVYSVYDSYYDQSRIFVIDAGQRPAKIKSEIVLKDADGNTFHFDPEGIAVREFQGGFWVASEGGGSCTGVGVCGGVTSLNLLLEVAPDGEVLSQIPLPDAVNALQRSNGYEGVASVGTGDDEFVYLAFQREWVGDPAGLVRIGRYEVVSGEWTFFYYPIDLPESPNGGFVGLSEITALDDETFAVIERDNQAGLDARIKKIYTFSISGLDPQPQGGVFPVVEKTFVRDLIPDLTRDNGLVIEKVEGLAVLANGDTLIVTDNDGVDGSSGETQFIHLGRIF